MVQVTYFQILRIGTWLAHYRAGSIGGSHESDSAESIVQIRHAGACSGRGPDVAWPYGRIGPARRGAKQWALRRQFFRPFVLGRRWTAEFCPVLLRPQLRSEERRVGKE